MTTAVTLLNVPSDDRTWDRWSFDLQQNVNDIGQALRKRGVEVPQYELYPLPGDQADRWLERVSQALGDFSSALGLQSADVENVDLEDIAARQAWIFQVYQEVQSARQALRI